MGKKVFITAALPYANGPLHLGHIRSTYLPGDIYARFRRLLGDDALYVCATDEHGTPIVLGAEKAKQTPKQFTDYFHQKDKKEFAALGFSFDIFHRTSSHENLETTQWFYSTLKEKGFIYKKEVEQNYCSNCKRFLPDRFVIGECPRCHAKNQYSDYCEACGSTYKADEIIGPKCITCGTTPEKRKSEHCFFKLSSCGEDLKSYLKGNSRLQPSVVNYVLNWIDSGLIDWDITRDLDWGIPIPGEPGKVFYVWFDAPIGYISSLKALKPDSWKAYLDSETIHFIGKDIIYHHFLFWPSMLKGVGLKQPDAIPVRGYLNLEGRKFSKSKNWFVSLEDYLSAFEPDCLRYYQTCFTPHDTVDADFQWKDFQAKVNNELVANLGNFIHRTLTMVKRDLGSTIPHPGELWERENSLLASISKARETYSRLMSEFQFKDAQELVMRLSSELNAYLSETQPWKLDLAGKQRVLYTCSRGISALAILAYPFLPFTSEKLAAMLGMNLKSALLDDCDKELLKPGLVIGEVKPLFRKIEDKEIEVQVAKLKKG